MGAKCFAACVSILGWLSFLVYTLFYFILYTCQLFYFLIVYMQASSSSSTMADVGLGDCYRQLSFPSDQLLK